MASLVADFQANLRAALAGTAGIAVPRYAEGVWVTTILPPGIPGLKRTADGDVLVYGDGVSTLAELDGIVGGGEALIAPEFADEGEVELSLTTFAREFRTLKSFGVVMDVSLADGADSPTGTDNTVAIQKAVDWCYQEGRALRVSSGYALCGKIVTNPYLVMIGDSKQTSGFLMKPGTTGTWWGDTPTSGNPRGAQKLTLYGLAWYAGLPDEDSGLDHIARWGYPLPGFSFPDDPEGGVPFGTEGMIRDCWFRDARGAMGLSIYGNAAGVSDIAVQDTLGCVLEGNFNHATNMFITGVTGPPVDGAGTFLFDIAGWSVKGVHIEAASTNQVPIRMRGDCNLHDVGISFAEGTAHSCAILRNEATYNHGQITGLSFNDTPPVFSVGVINVTGGAQPGARGGTLAGFTLGRDFVKGQDNMTGEALMRGARFQSFGMTLRKDGSTLKHRIGSLGDAEGTNGIYSTRVTGATTAETATPTGAAAFAGGVSVAANSRSIVLNVANVAADQKLAQTFRVDIVYNNTGTVLTAWGIVDQVTINGVTLYRPYIDLYENGTGTSFDPSTIPDTKAIRLQVQGFI